MLRYFSLPNAKIIECSGPDAERYLNARTTNKVPELEPGKSFWAAVLSPQGKTECLFRLLRKSKEDFLLVFNGGEAEEILTSLKRFVVTERIEFRDKSTELRLLHCIGAKDALSAMLGAEFPEEGSFVDSEELLISSLQRGTEKGFDILCSEEKLEFLLDRLVDPVELSVEQRLRERILAGLPGWPEDIEPDRVFLEYKRLDAISFEKGCYTGQEVIEKMYSRGKPPRDFIRVKASSVESLQAEQEIQDTEGNKVGSILRVSHDPVEECCYAFAAVKQGTVESGVGMEASGTKLEVLPDKN